MGKEELRSQASSSYKTAVRRQSVDKMCSLFLDTWIIDKFLGTLMKPSFCYLSYGTHRYALFYVYLGLEFLNKKWSYHEFVLLQL